MTLKIGICMEYASPKMWRALVALKTRNRDSATPRDAISLVIKVGTFRFRCTTGIIKNAVFFFEGSIGETTRLVTLSNIMCGGKKVVSSA